MSVSPNGTAPRLLLRPAEAAAALSVSRSTVYELMRTGELPTVRLGGNLRVPVAALEQWIAESTSGRTR